MVVWVQTVVSVLVVDPSEGVVDWGLLWPQANITRHKLGKDPDSNFEVQFY